MNRIVCVLSATGLLLTAAAVWAETDAVPTYFSIVSDQIPNSVQHASPITGLAALTEVPNQQPQCSGTAPSGQVSSNTSSTTSAAPPADGGGGDQCSSGSSCDHCNNGCSNDCDHCASDCGNDCDHDGCGDFCPECYHPDWTFKAGALVMQRISPRSAVIVEETSTGHSLMNASGFSFNWTGGLDASAIRRLNDDNDLELRYFGLNNWTARQSFTTQTPAEIPITPPLPVLVGTDVISQFATRLYSAEVNWRHEVGDQFSWLAGFRWLENDESLGITSSNNFISTLAHNQLTGGQIGADLKFWDDGNPFHIDSVIKAGIYDNSATNDSERRNQLAFAGEVGVTGIYQCCEHVALRAGYQVLWLTGVAVATDQLALVNPSPNIPINTSGNAIYHGAMFSIDLTW